jgi:DeoR/GlpR family transcriptional regulator of sugar metabolism
MLIVERQQKILDLLKLRLTVQLEDLARELDVSTSTVRRDLEVLEEQGYAKRTHGGAIFTGEIQSPHGVSGQTLTERMNEAINAKMAIGALAASLVKPQMTVLMDGGSTVIYAARQITARPIQVVTDSLAIAMHFHDDEQVETLLIGGSLYPRTGITIGPIATGTLAELHADLLLFSLYGILGDSVYNVNIGMAEVEQAMMRQASRCALLMDSSKFGRKSLARVCGVDELDHVITDSGVDPFWKEQLGDKLVIAEDEDMI